ncbi:hypothetical protein Tco_1335644 [Tanacetum coccineum]
MAQPQQQRDVPQDQLCPPNKRFELMDANKKYDLVNPQCPNESKILEKILLNHPLKLSVVGSAAVPWIYISQFWHTLKEDGSRYQFKFSLGTKELTMNVADFKRIFQLPQATDNNHAGFVDPSTFGQMVQFFRHNLGFKLPLRSPSIFVSKGLPRPWKTLCKIFAQCLTTRATRHDQPSVQIMQLLYCFINNMHLDYAKILWEGTGYKEKDKKKDKNDKTMHEIGKSEKKDFNQFQTPQFPDIHQFPQETSKEILQAREDLMETIQAFLKEYDHIPPNDKCIALLLAEERFLKIKQTTKEEHNQPEVMQELLLNLMNDLQILKGIQQEKKETAAQSFTPYWNFSMIDDEEARYNFLKDICTFLRKFSRIPFGVIPKVLSIAWERFGEIKDALTDDQYQQEDIQELMSKLLEDVRNISEELSEYINCPSWNHPTIFFDDDDEYTIIYSKPKAITPEEPDNSLSMRDEHLDTIPSVENLVPIPSKFKGISEDTCDVPVCEDPSTFDALNNHFEILSYSNDEGTSSDNDDFEDIEYVSLEEVNDVDQEEKEFDLEDILQIQDVILREKLLNISRLITNIESLNDNPTPDHVFKSSSSFPIPVTDSDSFFEKSNTSLSYSDNSLLEFETFSDHTEETRSGSTTTHANNSLTEYDSFLFEGEPDQEGLISIVISDNSNDSLLELPEFESFHFDLYPSSLCPPSEPPDVEICLNFEPDAPVINNFDESNEDECFYPGGGEINISQNVEDDDSFTFVIQTFLPFPTYPADSPLLLSTGE